MTNRFFVNRLSLFLLLLVGILLRLGYVFYFPHEPVVLDAALYNTGARNLLHYGTFSYSSGKLAPTAYTTPGYPLFLAAIYGVAGESNFQAVRIVQIVFNTVGLYFLYLVALLILGDRTWALAALAVGALHTPFIAISDLLLTEGVFLPLMALWLYLFVLAAQRKSIMYSAVGGGTLAVLCYVRPNVFLFPAFFFIVLTIKQILRTSFKKDAIKALLPTMKHIAVHYGVCLLLLTPWVVRNAIAFHRFVLFSSESGNPFFLGAFYNYKPEDYGHKIFQAGLNEFQQNERWWCEGWENIRVSLAREPMRYLRWYLGKTLTLWNRPYHLSAQATYTQMMVINMLHTLIVFSIIIAMLSWIVHGKDGLRAIMGLLFIYFTVFHVFFVAIPRYALPFLFFGGIFMADVFRDGIAYARERLASPKPAAIFAVFLIIAYLLLNLVVNFKGQNYVFSLSFHPIFLSKAGGLAFRCALLFYWLLAIPIFAKQNLLKGKKETALFCAVGLSVALLFNVLPTDIAVAFETPLRNGDVATHIIDVPKWAKGYSNCRLIIKVRNSDLRPTEYDFWVLMNGDEVYHAAPGADFSSGELQIPLAPIIVEKSKVLSVTVKSSGQREDGNYPLLVGSILTHRGLSTLNGQNRDLSHGSGTQRGAYFIGLRLYGKHPLLNVYFWRGSSTSKIHQLVIHSP